MDLTFAFCNRAKARGHRSPSLQLPHQILRFPSILQLHSIIKLQSPRGAPNRPSNLFVEWSVPNSKKIALP